MRGTYYSKPVGDGYIITNEAPPEADGTPGFVFYYCGDNQATGYMDWRTAQDKDGCRPIVFPNVFATADIVKAAIAEDETIWAEIQSERAVGA